MRERTWRVLTREDVRSLAWPTALRAAAAIGIPLTTATLLGHHDFGLMTSTGAFTVLYGAGRPARNRVRLLVSVALSFVVVSALGALTAGVGWAAIALLTAVGAVATFACHALRVGIPGAFFFIMVAGVAGFIPSEGHVEPAQMVLATAVGAACAVPVALADLLRAPAGPQERAVAAARAAVERFVGTSPRDPAAPELSQGAAAALHRAWQALWAAGDSVSDRPPSRARVVELRAVHRAYTTHLLPGTSPDPDLEADLAEIPLGVPSPWHLLRRDLRSPTVALSAAGRVAVGVLVAGLIALTMSTDHMYWAMMVAALVLHQGLDRRRSLIRARHRLVGTVLGLALFALISLLGPGPWATVILLIVLQGTVELAIPRNYAVAVTFITPLALTIATAGSSGAVWPVVAERLLDTVIGVGVAVGVLLVVGRRSAVPMLRSYVARVLAGSADALDHIGAGTVTGPEGRAARRELSLDMQDLAAVSARARSDDPARAEPWMAPREETARLGLTVLAHCAAARGPADGVGGATWAARSLAAAALRGTPPDPDVLRALRAVLHRPSDRT